MVDNMENGWIKLYRRLLDSPMWRCTTAEQKIVLITCMLLSNHRENKWLWNGEEFICKPGQFITSQHSLSEKTGVSRQCVRTALKKLEKFKFLTIKSTKTNSLITIENWDIYQGDLNNSNQETNQDLTKSQPRANQELTTNKNERMKECKKETKESVSFSFPAEKLTTVWNEVFSSHQIKILPQGMKQKIHTIVNLYPKYEKLSEWKKLFNDIKEKGEFLTDNHSTWFNLEWLCEPSKFKKTIKGTYFREKEDPTISKKGVFY